MINPFSDRIRWDHTSRPMTRRHVERRTTPRFRRPPAFASSPISSIPFFFLSLALLLLLVF